MRKLSLLLLLSPMAALAQGAPESIVPPAETQAQKPVSVKPEIVDSLKSPIPAAVAERPLEAPSPDAAGIADPDGKLNRDSWKGSAFSDIAPLLKRPHYIAPSLALHRLAFRLAAAPAAISGGAENAWLETRLNMLLKLGEEKALKDILAMIAPGNRPTFMDRLLVEQELLKLNTARACEKVAEDIARYQEPFWLKANAFCLAKNKKPEEAELALQLLSEQAPEEKPAIVLDEALHKMMGETVKVAPLKSFDLPPLELAIAIEAGLSFDPQIDKENGLITPAAARVLALNSKLSLTTRTQLAERAFRAGILSLDQLTALYKSAAIKPEQFTKVTKDKQFPSVPADAWALLFQLAEKATDAETGREALIIALPQFPKDLAARLFAPKVKAWGLPAAPSNAWKNFAPSAVALLLGAGEDKDALLWWKALPQSALLKPVVGLVAGEEMAGLDDWLAAQAKEHPDYALKVAAVYSGLGVAVSPKSWQLLSEVEDKGRPANIAVHKRLKAAADAKRIGEVAALGVSLLSDSGPSGVTAMVLSAVIEAYRAVGLEKEAKAIAREALLAAIP